MSSSTTGYVHLDQLFVGLTRPPMIFGVTYMYVVMNAMMTLIYFVMSSDFKVVLVALFLHGVSYAICLKEPLLIEIFIMRQGKFRRCRNRMFHGFRNSYDCF